MSTGVLFAESLAMVHIYAGTELTTGMTEMINMTNFIFPVIDMMPGIEVEVIIKEEANTNKITTRIRRHKKNNQTTNIGLYL